jgi:hypothetical protein
MVDQWWRFIAETRGLLFILALLIRVPLVAALPGEIQVFLPVKGHN